MTSMYRPHYGADPISHVLILEMIGKNATRAQCPAANIPSGKPGYATSCTLQVPDGAAGATQYVNEGTDTSCSFVKVGSNCTGSPLVLNGVTYVSMQLNSVEALRIDDAAISGMSTNQASGTNVFIASQDGGVDVALTGGKNGATIKISAGAGSSAGNNGGSGNPDGVSGSLIFETKAAPAVGDSGSGGKPGSIYLNSACGVFFPMAAPTSETGTTISATAAKLLNGEIDANGQTSAVALTLETGANLDAAVDVTTLGTGVAFDWGIINRNTSSGAITVSGATGHTFTGTGSATVAIGTSARFRTRRTGSSAWTTYRIS